MCSVVLCLASLLWNLAQLRFTEKREFDESMKVHEMNPQSVPVVEQNRTGDSDPTTEIFRRLIAGFLGHATWVKSDSEVDEDSGKFKIINRDELISFLEDPITHSLYFSEYILPVARETAPAEVLDVLDNLQAFDDRLYEDTVALAKVMCGLEPNLGSALGTTLDDDVIDEANDILRKVHENLPVNLTSVKPYRLSQMDCIPGLKKAGASRKGKQTKLEKFDEALSRCTMPLFSYDEATKEYDKMAVDVKRLQAALEEHGGEEVFSNWQYWGDILAMRKAQADIRERLRFGSIGRFFAETQPPPGNDPDARNESQWKRSVTVAAIVNLKRLQALGGTIDDADSNFASLLARIIAQGEPCPQHGEDYQKYTEQYIEKETYARQFCQSWSISLQSFGSPVMSAAFRGHAIDLDMVDAYGQLLYVALCRHNLYDEEKFGLIRRSTEFHSAWRAALAHVLDGDVAQAKHELIATRFGSAFKHDVPFVRKLLAEIHQALDALLALPEYTWLHDHHNQKANPKFSRKAALLSFFEREFLDKLVASMHRIGCPLYCLKFDGAVFGTEPSYKQLLARDVMADLQRAEKVRFVQKPFPGEDTLLFAKLPGALLKDTLADEGPLGGAIVKQDGLHQCLYNCLNHLYPDCQQTQALRTLHYVSLIDANWHC